MRITRLTSSAIGFVSAVSALLLTLGGGAASPSPDGRGYMTWPLDRSGNKTIELSIPHGYGFMNDAADAVNEARRSPGDDPSSGPVERTLLLEALWPGLISMKPENRSEFNVPGGGRLMTALVQSGAMDDFAGKHIDSLKIDFDIQLEWSTQNLCIAPMLQLDLGVERKVICFTRDRPDEKTPKFGLLRMGVDFSKYPTIPEIERSQLAEEDIYYLRDTTRELKTFIHCTAEEAKTVADGPEFHVVGYCKQVFVSSALNALVSVSYRRIYLKDWQAIQSAWDQRLNSFVVSLGR